MRRCLEGGIPLRGRAEVRAGQPEVPAVLRLEATTVEQERLQVAGRALADRDALGGGQRHPHLGEQLEHDRLLDIEEHVELVAAGSGRRDLGVGRAHHRGVESHAAGDVLELPLHHLSRPDQMSRTRSRRGIDAAGGRQLHLVEQCLEPFALDQAHAAHVGQVTHDQRREAALQRPQR